MARSRVDKRPQAIRDLTDIAVHLAEESGSDDLAFRFLDAAEASFEKLTAMPAMGVARKYRDPELEGVRMWRIAGFDSYLIFYRPSESGVEIIRVIHGKRDIEDLFGGRDRPGLDLDNAELPYEVREDRELYADSSVKRPPLVKLRIARHLLSGKIGRLRDRPRQACERERRRLPPTPITPEKSDR